MENIIDKLFDEENDENIVLYGEDGKAIEFEQIAVVPQGEQIYVILCPVDYAAAGIGEDEAIVFAVREVDDEVQLEVVTDDAVIDAVFGEYEKLLEE